MINSTRSVTQCVTVLVLHHYIPLQIRVFSLYMFIWSSRLLLEFGVNSYSPFWSVSSPLLSSYLSTYLMNPVTLPYVHFNATLWNHTSVSTFLPELTIPLKWKKRGVFRIPGDFWRLVTYIYSTLSSFFSICNLSDQIPRNDNRIHSFVSKKTSHNCQHFPR